MSSDIFTAILDEKIETFRNSFVKTAPDIFKNGETGKLIHPGEFGTYRESIAKEFLRLLIPMSLEIGSGFIITDTGAVSTQCDIVVYDRNSTPLIENGDRQTFFPVETVASIGEIKSDLDKPMFIEAINKLAKIKMLREQLVNPVALKRKAIIPIDPTKYPYDNIFSFLICHKLNFNISNIVNEIDQFYTPEVKPWQKHNLILSISDGLLLYFDKNDKTLMYPYVIDQGALKNRYLTPGENKNCHIHYASSYLFMGTTSASIFYPETSNYIPMTGGFYSNQI